MTNKTLRDYINLVENAQRESVAEGADEGLSKYSTERLQAYVKKVSGGGVPAFGSGAQLKRVQAELKRREQGVAEGSETHKYQVVVKGHKRSYSVWVEAKNEEVAIIRAQQYVAREHSDKAKHAAVVDMKQGVAEGSEIAVDRKTGKVYMPNKELDKLLNQHKAQFQGMTAIEKAQAKKKTPDNKGVAEDQLEETSPDAIEKIEQLVRK